MTTMLSANWLVLGLIGFLIAFGLIRLVELIAWLRPILEVNMMQHSRVLRDEDEAEEGVSRDQHSSRFGLFVGPMMAVLFSFVLLIGSLYVLLSGPTFVLPGPDYDQDTKCWATATITALVGFWFRPNFFP